MGRDIALSLLFSFPNGMAVSVASSAFTISTSNLLGFYGPFDSGAVDHAAGRQAHLLCDNASKGKCYSLRSAQGPALHSNVI